MPSKSFSAQGAVEATVRLAIGQVTVTATESTQIRVSVEPSEVGDASAQALADSATISFEDDELLVEVPERGGWLRRSPGSVHVRLELPAGSSVSTAAGVVTLTSTGRLDQVSIRTGVGTIDVEHAAGVSVKGGQTTVDIASAGDVTVKSGRGDLRVGVAQDIHVKTGQGKVDVGASSGDVHVKGAMVSLDVAEASGGEITFEAAMGSARVGVTEGTTVEVDLSSATGDARCELSMEDGDGDGEAALQVRLRTTNGDVVVTRAQELSAAS